jgi:hypothetical protein
MINMLFPYICAGVIQHGACSKTLEAGSIELGIPNTESQLQGVSNRWVKHNVSEGAQEAAGVTSFIIPLLRDKRLAVTLGHDDLYLPSNSTIGVDLGANMGHIVFSLRF